MTIELDGVNNTLKTDKIEPQSGTALQVGASGDTITLPSGATLNIAGTISNSGTATGFGAIDWQTSDVKTSNFSASAGEGYFVDTTSGAITVSLPAGSAGAQVALIDYAATWDTNNCIISANGSDKIQGSTDDAVFSREREALQLVFVDSTQGWLIESNTDQGGTQATYISASGGTITTDGDFKVHTFTSSGTFTVASVGNAAGSNTVDYLVVAGGAGGGNSNGGGGGAGGMRFSFPNPSSGGTPVTAQGYPITIGAGGAGQPAPSTPGRGSDGNNSSGLSITSSGGGGGGGGLHAHPQNPGGTGGSGGGGSTNNGSGGTGNNPPVSPPQGNNGGVGSPTTPHHGGGGGGHTSAGGAYNAPTKGLGGSGTALTITGSSVTTAGGGGGAVSSGAGPNAGPGGGGSGGQTNGDPGAAGTANTGGGGGGGVGPPGTSPGGLGGNGGSGKMVIRYKFQN